MSSTNRGLEASPIDKIDQHLYLGSLEARSPALLEQHKIKRIIRVATRDEEKNSYSGLPPGIEEKVFYVKDLPSCQIRWSIMESIPLIERSIQQQDNILIHCQAGVSRSASIVIGYLIHSRRLSAKEALDYVQQRRPCVRPNPGFWRELQELESR